MAVRERLGAGLDLLGEAVLSSYAQILLARSRLVGLVLLGATFVYPPLGALGLASVLLALAVAAALGLSPELRRSGLYSYNALLVGLGAAASFAAEPRTWALAAVGVIATVVLTAALHSAMWATFNLPVLTLPFLSVFYLLSASAPLVGLEAASVPDPGLLVAALPEAARRYLEGLGSIFFMARADVGVLVAIALVSFSRIATLLSLLAVALIWIAAGPLGFLPAGDLLWVASYNFVLTAVALGGVWFVPSTSSFALASFGVALCGLITLGLAPLLGRLGLPLLITPFNLTVIMVLYAMRQRVRDRLPKAVDFLLGTPEENLDYSITRLERFGSRFTLRFAAPFLGRWTCTQGVDGEHTHKGAWRHAFDFEVMDGGGRAHRGSGVALADYHCYRLPVLAAADGTVIKVVDGIADNGVGEVNVEEPWGNAVVVMHAPFLYSVVAHLVPGSIKVREGQIVRQGEQLGLCGSSGRSPRPHLHFQLQSSDRVGAPTIESELHDLVVQEESGALQLRATWVPRRGEVLRNLEPQPDVQHLARLGGDKGLRFSVDWNGRSAHERIETEIDLFGNFLLRSPERSAVLYYQPRPSLLTLYEVLGRRRSVLHLLRIALGRLPLEMSAQLVWEDVVPARYVLPLWASLARDLVAPFMPHRGFVMRYGAAWRDGHLIVEGRSLRLRRDSEPLVHTRAELRQEQGLWSVEASVAGRRFSATRAEPAPEVDTTSIPTQMRRSS